jgi:hypothetical protein
MDLFGIDGYKVVLSRNNVIEKIIIWHSCQKWSLIC